MLNYSQTKLDPLLTFKPSFARDRARERYGENKIIRNDVLGSMVRRGLSLDEAEAEGLFAA